MTTTISLGFFVLSYFCFIVEAENDFELLILDSAGDQGFLLARQAPYWLSYIPSPQGITVI